MPSCSEGCCAAVRGGDGRSCLPPQGTAVTTQDQRRAPGVTTQTAAGHRGSRPRITAAATARASAVKDVTRTAVPRLTPMPSVSDNIRKCQVFWIKNHSYNIFATRETLWTPDILAPCADICRQIMSTR